MYAFKKLEDDNIGQLICFHHIDPENYTLQEGEQIVENLPHVPDNHELIRNDENELVAIEMRRRELTIDEKILRLEQLMEDVRRTLEAVGNS